MCGEARLEDALNHFRPKTRTRRHHSSKKKAVTSTAAQTVDHIEELKEKLSERLTILSENCIKKGRSTLSVCRQMTWDVQSKVLIQSR